MKCRFRKPRLYAKVQSFKHARHWMTDEEFVWEFMQPLGREFGSQDFERLMALDAMKEKAMPAERLAGELLADLPLLPYKGVCRDKAENHT